MNTFTLGYAIAATLFFLVIAKYDIHMFQLTSYRNNRYFRWLIPGNIISLNRIFALLMLATAFIPGYYGIALAACITIASYTHCFREKFKTPLVYTMRVKRLFTTDIILFLALSALALLFVEEWATATIGVALALSNAIMLLANIVNTPIEKE